MVKCVYRLKKETTQHFLGLLIINSVRGIQMNIQKEEQVEVQKYYKKVVVNLKRPFSFTLTSRVAEGLAAETVYATLNTVLGHLQTGVWEGSTDDYVDEDFHLDFSKIFDFKVEDKTKQKFRIRAEAYAGSFVFGDDETYLVEAFDEDEAKEIFEEDNDATQFVEDSLYNVYWDDIDAIPVQDDGQDIELQEAS